MEHFAQNKGPRFVLEGQKVAENGNLGQLSTFNFHRYHRPTFRLKVESLATLIPASAPFPRFDNFFCDPTSPEYGGEIPGPDALFVETSPDKRQALQADPVKRLHSTRGAFAALTVSGMVHQEVLTTGTDGSAEPAESPEDVASRSCVTKKGPRIKKMHLLPRSRFRGLNGRAQNEPK